MKKYFSAIALGFGILALSACNPTQSTTKTTTGVETTSKPLETTTVEPTQTTTEAPIEIYTKELDARYTKGTTSGTYKLADDIQDGVILHAWNWSYNTIKNNMAQIAQAGYTAVQTSPVQQSKATAKTGAWTSEWSMLYQPVSFSVAADSYLGTKEELAEMCDVAKGYGVKVIVDIVSNHMGNNNEGKGWAPAIETYEPQIWNNRSLYFHNGDSYVSDTNARTVTQNELSELPDLNTSNAYIQGRVISLLEECVDAGVDGFRFDAAKHIETPDDGDVASNYWPNVLNTTAEYALSEYNKEIYYYGEILNTPGGGRSYNSYTQYMSITDNKYGSNLLSSLGASASKSILSNFNYNFSEDGTKAIVWAESHDTYADKSTSGVAQEKINRVYALEAARGGSSALYFARPQEFTAMGEMGTKVWKSNEIAAVNKFHNHMLGKNETITFEKGFVAVERGTEGAVVVSASPVREAKTVTVALAKLKDGKYYNQVNGEEVVVANGRFTTTMDTSGIVVLEKSAPSILPEIAISSETGYFYDTYSVTVEAKMATSASYSINNQAAVSFTGSKTIELTPDATGVATLEITVTNEAGSVTEAYTYKQVARKEGYAAIAGLKDTENNQYVAWVFWTGKGGTWKEIIIEGDVAYIPAIIADGEPNFKKSNYVLVAFAKDYDVAAIIDTSANVWADRIGQSQDIKMEEDVVEVSLV